MSENSKEKMPQPEIGPFVFPTLLAAFGLWCFYDGWLSSNPKMQDYTFINRIGSLILLPWAAFDFYRTWKINKTDTLPPTKKENDKEENSPS